MLNIFGLIVQLIDKELVARNKVSWSVVQATLCINKLILTDTVFFFPQTSINIVHYHL